MSAPVASATGSRRNTVDKSWLVIAVGLAAMYLPSFWDLRNIWSSDAQGHGPIILLLAGWLVWRSWPRVPALQQQDRPQILLGSLLVGLSCLIYALGRSQSILFLEVGSLISMLAGILLLQGGPRLLAAFWFPLFFMCFMVPLPMPLVAAVTGPMKIAVSWAAESLLHNLGYPIARSGVILEIGPYQLLVADACAGLHSLLTLEALGLLYLNIFQSASAVRNIAMAVLVIPVGFLANVIRVIVLSLITFYWGDDAGQGFLHGFAGMFLFMVALMLLLALDSVITRFTGSATLKLASEARP